ncbi:hypothetical protein K7G98_22515 [Saccharothrix sp. MB29]|nr:hypothetical protein [Saccharothrix sp. MB29]
MPAGDRVGSDVVICPMITNGVRGSLPHAISVLATANPLKSPPRWTVPAPRASGAVHGMGPSSAQSTFTVASSHSNRPRSDTSRGGRWSGPTMSR